MRRMRAVRPKLLLALALCVLLAGSLSTSTALAAGSSRAHSASSHGPTVSRALQMLLSAGSIAQTAYNQYFNAYVAAKHSLGKLKGTRHEELGAVLENLQQMAAAGALIPSRLPVLFLTLERNRQWWTTEPLLASDERVSFPESKLIWEHYPGQGIEIQWLATFGEGNGYFLSGHENANLRQLVSEMLPLATQRAGGIAWEYMFHFDGGSPPWTSGLSQGTALQVLARAYQRFKEPADLAAAQQALGIFQTPPPQGVRVQTPAGALYAEYTYAPSDRILNGFIQSLVGLYDYTSITKDPLGQTLFEAGDAEARALTAPLRHRLLVAVRPVRRIGPQLPRTARRIPAAPVRTHQAKGPPITAPPAGPWHRPPPSTSRAAIAATDLLHRRRTASAPT